MNGTESAESKKCTELYEKESNGWLGIYVKGWSDTVVRPSKDQSGWVDLVATGLHGSHMGRFWFPFHLLTTEKSMMSSGSYYLDMKYNNPEQKFLEAFAEKTCQSFPTRTMHHSVPGLGQVYHSDIVNNEFLLTVQDNMTISPSYWELWDWKQTDEKKDVTIATKCIFSPHVGKSGGSSQKTWCITLPDRNKRHFLVSNKFGNQARIRLVVGLGNIFAYDDKNRIVL